jgi:hypothetical protein
MVAEMTVWASPGLIVDDFHPDIGALAIPGCRAVLLSALFAACRGHDEPLSSRFASYFRAMRM